MLLNKVGLYSVNMIFLSYRDNKKNCCTLIWAILTQKIDLWRVVIVQIFEHLPWDKIPIFIVVPNAVNPLIFTMVSIINATTLGENLQ